MTTVSLIANADIVTVTNEWAFDLKSEGQLLIVTATPAQTCVYQSSLRLITTKWFINMNTNHWITKVKYVTPTDVNCNIRLTDDGLLIPIKAIKRGEHLVIAALSQLLHQQTEDNVDMQIDNVTIIPSSLLAIVHRDDNNNGVGHIVPTDNRLARNDTNRSNDKSKISAIINKC